MYIMGIDPTQVKTSTEGAAFGLGTLGANGAVDGLQTTPTPKTGPNGPVTEAGPKVYVYAKSAAGTTAGQHCLIDGSTFDAVAATATNGASGTGMGKRVGLCVATVAAGGFGWYQVYGQATGALTVAATVLNSGLSLSGTAGAVDDLAVAGSIPVIGEQLIALTGTSGTVYLNWPIIGHALTA